MKKYITLVVAAGLALGVGCGIALAAETAAPKVTKTETKTTKTADKKTVKVKIEEAKKTAVKTHTDEALTILKDVLTKEAVVGAKIENRILKLQTEGKDITGAVAKIQEVHTLWDKARADLEALPAKIDAALGEMEAKEARATIRSAVEAIAAEIRDEHQKMGATIELLVAGLPPAPAQPAPQAPAPAPAN